MPPITENLTEAVFELQRLLGNASYRFGIERDLQDDLEEVLQHYRLEFSREHHLDPRSVIDFRIGRIGVECKVAGSPQEVLRQCRRYLKFDELDGLLLVTSRAQHRWGISDLGGKPFGVVWVAGRF